MRRLRGRCPPAELAAETRLRKVEAQLLERMQGRAVIALQVPLLRRPPTARQEVSTDWTGALHCFFAKHGYQSVFSNYAGRSAAAP